MASTPSSDVVESARRQRTRTRLLDAALEVFAEGGMRASSVESITDRAGFTRGAFYSNFESKEDLMVALFDREHRRDMERIHDALDALLPRLAEQRANVENNLPWTVDFIADMLEFILEGSTDVHGVLLQSEFILDALRDPHLARRYLEHNDGLLVELAQIVVQALRSVGVEFTAEPEHVLRIIIDMHHSEAQNVVLAMSRPSTTGAEVRREAHLGAIVAVINAFTAPIARGID